MKPGAATKARRERSGPTGSRPAAASRGGGEPLAFTIGGEGEARLDVLTGQPREIGGNLVLSQPGSGILQHILDGDAQPPDARLAAALAGFRRDDVLRSSCAGNTSCRFCNKGRKVMRTTVKMTVKIIFLTDCC